MTRVFPPIVIKFLSQFTTDHSNSAHRLMSRDTTIKHCNHLHHMTMDISRDREQYGDESNAEEESRCKLFHLQRSQRHFNVLSYQECNFINKLNNLTRENVHNVAEGHNLGVCHRTLRRESRTFF